MLDKERARRYNKYILIYTFKGEIMKPKLSDLTLRERIAQTGLTRPTMIEGDDYFAKNGYGGMWNAVFEYNRIKQKISSEAKTENVSDDMKVDTSNLAPSKKFVAKMTNITKSMKIPVLIATDAEKGKAFYGMSETTSCMGLGATDDVELVEELASCIAKECKSIGIRWIWGPILDNPSPFLSSSMVRNFSDDVEKIKAMGKAMMRGFQKNGLAATAKHFPGTDKHEYRDAHYCATVLRQSYDEWWKEQGCIFQELIDSGVDTVMVGHSAFPAIDDTKVQGGYLPATLSYKIITELLKEKMGFKGLVITDAVGMKGVTSVYPKEKLCVELLKAGNDMILGFETPDYIDIIEKAVLSGELSEERVNDACQKVLDLKEKLGLFDENYELGEGLTSELIENTKKTSYKVAEKGITLICNENKMIPLDKNKIKKVLICYLGYAQNVHDRLYSCMKPAFEARGASVDIIKNMTRETIKTTKDYDLVLYVGHLASHAPFGVAAFYADEALSFSYIMTEEKDKAIGVSLSSPYIYYDYFTNAPTFVNAYWNNEETIETVVKGLYGECEFGGKSPVDLVPIR